MKTLKNIILKVFGNRFETRYLSLIPIPLMLLLVSFTGFAQTVSSGMQSIKDVDQSIVSAIAPYNEDVRNAILDASQYPQVLTKLAQIHDQTSQEFQNTIQPFSQKKQNWFYEVSRYSKLMHNLAVAQKGLSRNEVYGMIENPTEELKDAAWKLYENHHSDLAKVDDLNQQAKRAFEGLIAPLDKNGQDAFYKLVDMPDVLSLLNDHIDLTVRLGDSFKNDPEGVRRDLADAHENLDSLNKSELSAYQQELSQNPQAMNELQLASQQYAKENGYSYPAPAADTVINYNNYSPYSYWFGYPGWYGSAMWYPGSIWSNTGFYFGMGGSPYIFGLPSLAFSNWFFGGAYRNYPHLYRQYDHYYQNNITQHRFISANNSGFMGVARQHFNPNVSDRSNWLRSNGATLNRQPRTVAPQVRSNVQPQQNFNRSNANTYHSQSWGGFSRGGGFSGGSSFRGGFSGGGMRGGRH